MKKIIVVIFAFISNIAYSDVNIIESGNSVLVTWTYTDSKAKNVGLVGDFINWELKNAIPMKKSNDTWEFTLKTTLDKELQYKFSVDGEWTEDPNSPDQVSEGFGGSNGFIDIASFLGKQNQFYDSLNIKEISNIEEKIIFKKDGRYQIQFNWCYILLDEEEFKSIFKDNSKISFKLTSSIRLENNKYVNNYTTKKDDFKMVYFYLQLFDEFQKPIEKQIKIKISYDCFEFNTFNRTSRPLFDGHLPYLYSVKLLSGGFLIPEPLDFTLQEYQYIKGYHIQYFEFSTNIWNCISNRKL